MTYRLLSYRDDAAEPIAGLMIGGRVHRVGALPGLARQRTMLDVLNEWEYAKPLLNKAASELRSDAGAGVALSEVELLAPVPNPGAVFCAGGNFRDHVEEMRAAGKTPASMPLRDILGDSPWHFLKTSRGSVVGPGSVVANPGGSKMFDWEVELVAVIGKPARGVSVKRALEHVGGYTIGNDLSARDRAVRTEIEKTVPFRFDWLSHKCFDGSFPCGPWITPAHEISDPQQLGMKLWVNDELMQDSSTAHMIFGVAQQISHLSRHLTLNPGDLIATGTPAGVGSGRGRSLNKGDVVRLEIERIGEFSHSIAG